VAGEHGRDAAALGWDHARPALLEPAFARLVDQRGPVDVLVNCAGIMELRWLAETPWELGARLLRIDLESPLRLMSLAVPSMIARGRGAVVNVSSMAGVTPLRGATFYGAAKAGIAMASEVARVELAPRGVQVVTVYPGPVRSPLEQRARAQLAPSLLSRFAPTGDAETLGRLVVEACERGAPRVVYPALYRLGERLPNLARAVTGRFSPPPEAAQLKA
jgi:NAD(P)-dependent dehydrogenase (short-subunit alcohol dehydrogenase family)